MTNDLILKTVLAVVALLCYESIGRAIKDNRPIARFAWVIMFFVCLYWLATLYIPGLRG